MWKAIVVSLIGLFPLGAGADPVLLMAEESGCYWCAKWHEEIGPIYPKTAEGRTAPLQRYDLHADTPDVVFAKRVHLRPPLFLPKTVSKSAE